MSLFSPYQLGTLTLPNRIVMAPMTRSRAIGNLPNQLLADYYAARASAGLIVTEGIAPSPDGLGYARTPGLYQAAQVAGFRAVTDAVHTAGGRIVAQLMHVGRVAHPSNMPEQARILAPSAVAARASLWTDQNGQEPMAMPEAMTLADIGATSAAFVRGARNAIAAGFDGVELHGANGYLLEQFLNPHTNQRDDAYGGGVASRIRFVVDVARAVGESIGRDRVGLRLSPYNTFNDMPIYDSVDATYRELARELSGQLSYLHVVNSPYAGFTATAAAIRSSFGGPLIVNGGYDRTSAEAALHRGDAALVAFGRPFIANPDLVGRLERGAPLAVPNPATFYTPGPDGYLDYSALPS